MRRNNKNLGWRGEKERHSLASRGIRTSLVQQFHVERDTVPPRKLYDVDYDYIKYYWNDLIDILLEEGHWNKRLDDTEIDKSIIQSEEIKKLLQLFWWCHINYAWEYFDFDEVSKSMGEFLKGRIKFYNVLETVTDKDIPTIKECHHESVKFVESYNPNWNMDRKIQWFDTLIHMEHERGLILVETNISLDALREYFENKYL